MIRQLLLCFFCATAFAASCKKLEAYQSFYPDNSLPSPTAAPTVAPTQPPTVQPTQPPTRPPFFDLFGLVNFFLSPFYPKPAPSPAPKPLCPACFPVGSLTADAWRAVHLSNPSLPPVGICAGSSYAVIFEGSPNKCCCYSQP